MEIEVELKVTYYDLTDSASKRSSKEAEKQTMQSGTSCGATPTNQAATAKTGYPTDSPDSQASGRIPAMRTDRVRWSD
jgi:hypothetical protein